MTLTDAWRELHRTRFGDLPLDCGNLSDPGIIYSEDLRDWSDKATTPDQGRMERYIDRYDLKDARILHVGIGNSGFAKRFFKRVKEIVGTTIDSPEIKVAQALHLPNYRFVVHNKYSGRDRVVEGQFDFILDNNPTSPCCCIRHLSDLFDFYLRKLTPGGQIVTDRVGLGWIPDDSNPRWRFDFDDLAAVGEAVGLSAFRMNDSLYVLARSTPLKPDLKALGRNVGRRIVGMPGRILKTGPRGLARAARRSIKWGLRTTLPSRLAKDLRSKREQGSSRSRLPNLFIVGAPKCGTTAWVEYLGAHPDVFFPKYKDQCFFAFDLPNFRLTRTEADYAELFADSGSAKVIGEASAMYLFSEAAAKAIHDHDPEAKILIFLREQEDYLPSLHNQFLREFAEEIEDFETVWRLSGQRPSETIPATCLEPRTLDYAAMGRFSEQVERYLARFPAEQLQIVHFREWTSDPRRTYLEILDFLGLSDDGRTEFPLINRGTTYRSRNLARWMIDPPLYARRIARLIKALPLGGLIYRSARAAGFSSTPSYRSEIAPKLRDEIKRYYAKDNARLEEQLGADKALKRNKSD